VYLPEKIPFTFVLVSILLFGSKLFAAPPNVVFIMVDDLGVGELQWFPDKADISQYQPAATDPIKTPSIFALAQGGLRFTNYHSPAPVCSPGRRR